MKTKLALPASLRDLPRQLLMALVRGYRLMFSPWLGSACRFEPTCSGYALQALQSHGALAGSYIALRRLIRCHPFCPGGHDPVPPTAPRLFSSLMQRSEANTVESASSLSREKTTP